MYKVRYIFIWLAVAGFFAMVYYMAEFHHNDRYTFICGLACAACLASAALIDRSLHGPPREGES